MMIQTIARHTLAPTADPRVAIRAAAPEVIVAPEGSELASRLRATGWVARSGWRSHSAGRPAIWLVRFECPAPAGNVAALAA
ncbi:MAG: hypothetical protein ACRD1H_21060 [Vicinamibacterales bacterium]